VVEANGCEEEEEEDERKEGRGQQEREAHFLALTNLGTSKGRINKAVDGIVEMLDQLIEEKQTLLKQQQDKPIFSTTDPCLMLQQQVCVGRIE
jgi:hypothetical protein